MLTVIIYILCISAVLQADYVSDSCYPATAGDHCNSSIPLGPSPSCANQSVYCVTCFYPAHCLVDNTCLVGTGGPTCERCLTKQRDDEESGYYEVGSMCANCPLLPWGAAVLALLIILVAGNAAAQSLRTSHITKLKLLMHYLQFMLLTVYTKLPWPPVTIMILGNTRFSFLNSLTVPIECYLSLPFSIHYMEWLTSFTLPLVALLLTYFIDRIMKKQIKRDRRDEVKQKLWQRRSNLRQLFTVLALSWYTPIAISGFQTFRCSSGLSKSQTFGGAADLFLPDQDPSHTCDTFLFQAYNFFGACYLILIIIPSPLLVIFLTVRYRKWNLLGKKNVLHGSLYESFNTRVCYWEAIVMLRKLVCLVLINFAFVSTLIQVSINAGITLVYIVMVIIVRPYRTCCWKTVPSLNLHNLFECVSNMGILMLQVCGVLLALDYWDGSVDYVIAGVMGVVVIMWIVLFLMVPHEAHTDEYNFDIPQEAQAPVPFVFWRRNKVGEGITDVELKTRQQVLNF